jgi:Flp pilus assembly protein TadG
MLRRIRRGARHLLGRILGRRLGQDESGLAGVEFALVLPFLLLLCLGMCDLAPALMAQLHAGQSTESTGDLTGEYTEMQTSDMVNVFAAASDIMEPYSGATLTVRITSVYSDGNGGAWVYWSCGQGSLPALTAKTAVTVTPTGTPVTNLLWPYTTTYNGTKINGTNTSYIMVETKYTYTTPVQFVLTAPITISNTSYLTPRNSAYVAFPWDGVAGDDPTAPASTTRTASVTLSNGAICNYAT